MKRVHLRFLAATTLTGALLASVPAVGAVVLQDSQSYAQLKESDKHKKKKQLPEGSGGAILVLAAGVLGGGLMLWRRKKSEAAT